MAEHPLDRQHVCASVDSQTRRRLPELGRSQPRHARLDGREVEPRPTSRTHAQIVRTLRPLQQVNVRIAGHDHLAEDPLTPAAEAILDAVNLTPQ